jgi:hypothetical protein
VFTYSSHSIEAGRRVVSRSLAGALAALTLTAGTAVFTASANAAQSACGSGTLSTPFSKWGDNNLYTLIPGGSFEAHETAWTLTGGANVASGSEPFAATGTLGASSLAIPAGGWARSPFVCVTPEDRTFRFFDRGEKTTGTLVASVIYKTPVGLVSVQVGKVTGSSSWAPSQILHTGAAAATAILGGDVNVAFQFTSTSGTSRVDDVFLDPRHH